MNVRVPQWLGWAAVGAGGLLVVGELLHLPFVSDEMGVAATEPLYQAGSVVFLVGAVLLILGLGAIHAVHEDSFGRFGRAATLLAYVFAVLLAGAAWVTTFVEPTLALEVPELLAEESLAGPVMVGFGLTFVGASLAFLLLAAAAFRAGVVSKAASVLVMLGALYGLLPFAVGVGIVIGLGFAWWGLDAAHLLAGEPDHGVAVPKGAPA